MHFYLGNIKKARYYHDRTMRGKEEILNSNTRLLSDNNYRNKMKDRDRKFLTHQEIRDKETTIKLVKGLKIDQISSYY